MCGAYAHKDTHATTNTLNTAQHKIQHFHWLHQSDRSSDWSFNSTNFRLSFSQCFWSLSMFCGVFGRQRTEAMMLIEESAICFFAGNGKKVKDFTFVLLNRCVDKRYVTLHEEERSRTKMIVIFIQNYAVIVVRPLQCHLIIYEYCFFSIPAWCNTNHPIFFQKLRRKRILTITHRLVLNRICLSMLLLFVQVC